MESAENNEDGAVVITNIYGDFCFRKARRKRQKVLVRELFNDYANNTSLHGLSYTTKRGLTLTEKIFWLITFIISLCLCCYLIRNVWMKWQTSPVIVTVSEQLVSVGKVPFPSVTICPQLKCEVSIYNYTAAKIKFDELMKNTSEILPSHTKEFAKFDDLSHVCGQSMYSDEFEKAFPRKYSNADVALNIKSVAPRPFLFCEWRGTVDSRCKDTLTEVFTSEGLCYNVNTLAANEILREENIQKEYPYLTANTSSRNWTTEHGYIDGGPDVYPVPGKENGDQPDLQIYLTDYLGNHDEVCNVVNSGFKVFVQHPTDLPQSSLYYYAILNTQVSSMALSFSILNTTESLRKYDPEVRQCYFPNERYLKYFKIYTANNCRMECLSNITFKNCGCVGFYMPHENSERICTVQSISCMRQARENVLDTGETEAEIECHCLPACNSVEYEAEILKTDYNLKKLIKVYNKIYKYPAYMNGTQFSKLEMYFKRPRFLSMRRSELFGVTDFLSNIGGLLGLFLGFSFLSLIELFYFATLRLCCTLKKDLKKEKIQRRNTIAMPSKF